MRYQQLFRLAMLLTIGLLCGHRPAGAETVTYTVKNAGLVSLGIYDAKGRLVRTLQSGKKQDVGTYQVEWDGKDDAGEPVAAGTYTCKGLSAAVGCEFVMMMGNAGTPQWSTEDGMGGWGGVHGNVRGVAATPDGNSLYLLWGMEEGTPALLKINPRGDAQGRLKLWGAHNNWGWGYCQAVAADDEYVYVGNNQGGSSPGGAKESETVRSLIWRVKADTGEYAQYGTENNGLILASEIPQERMPIDTPAWVMYGDPSKRQSVGCRTNLFALAVDGAHLYCSLRQENKIAVFDKKTGAPVREFAVPEPGGLAMAPDGNLYVISRHTVLKLSPQGKTLGTVIGSGLAAPYGITVDRQGTIYLSDQGTSMQIKLFTPAGKLIKTLGRLGGRHYGGEWAKMKMDLLYPTQLAVSKDGAVYVGEDCAPKRVVVFKGGRFEREWIGPLASGCSKLDIADEDNPQYLYQTYWPFDLVRYKVDYAKKTFVLDAVWGYSVSVNGQEVGDVPARQNERHALIGGIKENGAYQSYGSRGCIRHLNGKTYLFLGNGLIAVYRIDGHKLIPCTTLSPYLGGEPLDAITKNWPSRPAMDATFGTHPYVWRDANHDWQAQPHEMDWSIPQGWQAVSRYAPTVVRSYVDAQMNLYFEHWKLPFEGLDAQGNPRYSWQHAVKLPTWRPMGKIGDPPVVPWQNSIATLIGLEQPGDIFPGGREVGLYVDPQDNSYYLAADVEGKGKGIGWAANGIFARIGKADAAGNWIWMAGTKATGFSKPGQFYKPSQFTGLLQGCLFVNDWNGQIRIFDKDSGLYVGSLFNDAYRGVRPDEYLISVEYTEGCVYHNKADGNTYALAGDSHGLKVFRITGLDGIERFTGEITRGQ